MKPELFSLSLLAELPSHRFQFYLLIMLGSSSATTSLNTTRQLTRTHRHGLQKCRGRSRIKFLSISCCLKTSPLVEGVGQAGHQGDGEGDGLGCNPIKPHPAPAPLCCSLPREESAPLKGATAGDGEEHDDVGGGDGGGQLALGGRREAPHSRGVAHGRLQRGKASCAWLH